MKLKPGASVTVDPVTGEVTIENPDGTTLTLSYDEYSRMFTAYGNGSVVNISQFSQGLLSAALLTSQAINDYKVPNLVMFYAAVRTGDHAYSELLKTIAEQFDAESLAHKSDALRFEGAAEQFRNTAIGMKSFLSGQALHLGETAQAKLNQAIASSERAAALTEKASAVRSTKAMVDARYAHVGAAIDIVQLLVAIQDGEVNGILKTSSGILGGIVLAAIGTFFGAPLAAGIALGIGGGILAEIFYDAWIADGFEDAGNIWDYFSQRAFSPEVNESFEDARRFVPRRDPLVLDLDGDGIETVGPGTVLFDHDGDGVKSGSGWASPHDGFLVLDRNENGLIDSGKELFGADTVLSDGTHATSGFAALADLDTNGNALFDAGDTEFANVRVWRDVNQDGVSQSEELSSLSSLGVVSVNLTPTSSTDIDLGNGNSIDNLGYFTRANGSTGGAGDLLLAINHFFRDYSGDLDPVPVSEEASVLTGIRGSGVVRDLAEAATLSPSLMAEIQTLQPSVTRSEMQGSLDSIISLWADTSQMLSTEALLEASGGVARRVIYHGPVPANVQVQGQSAVEAWMETQHLELSPLIAVLERFNGSSLVSVFEDQVSTAGSTFSWIPVNTGAGSEEVMRIALPAGQIEVLRRAYSDLRESVYAGLVSATRLRGYLSAVTGEYINGSWQYDLSALNLMLVAKHGENLTEALEDLIDLHKYAGQLLERAGWDGMALLESWISDATSQPGNLAALSAAGITLGVSSVMAGSVTNDVLWGGQDRETIRGNMGADLLVGNAGDDTLNGDQGGDILYGGSGSDHLYGGAGIDSMFGGVGDDRLFGEAGDDILDGGAGDDQLSGGAGNDTYVFGRGDGQDTIIYDHDLSPSRMNVLEFKADILVDDVVVKRSSDDLILTIAGTTDQVTVRSFFTSNLANGVNNPVQMVAFADGTTWDASELVRRAFVGTVGADFIYGTQDADVIYGQSGSDTLRGNGGNDVLYGGDGIDTLHGDAGDDILEGGAGNDSLIGGLGNDTYLFGLGDGQDTIVIDSEVTPGKLNVLQFKEGISPSDVIAARVNSNIVLTIIGTSDKVTITSFFSGDQPGGTNNPVQEVRFTDGTIWDASALLDRVFAGTDGADIIYGTPNADVIHGQAGNDMLYGLGGDDILDGGAGDDQLSGGAGNDTYVFGRGDGQDTIIYDHDLSPSRMNVLEFKADILVDDVVVKRSSDDLILTIAGTTDQVTVRSFFTSNLANGVNNPVQMVAFADGTTWDASELVRRAFVGTVGADFIYGTQDADVIYGQSGSDTLRGNGGNDVLYGGDGIDTLHGDAGDDILEGGAGNDSLIGGLGNDTYLFGLGDGQDTIVIDSEVTPGKLNVLQFKEGISPSDVIAARVNSNIVLTIIGTSDKVTITSFFSGDQPGGANNPVQEVRFTDGTIWDAEALAATVDGALVAAMQTHFGSVSGDLLDPVSSIGLPKDHVEEAWPSPRYSAELLRLIDAIASYSGPDHSTLPLGSANPWDHARYIAGALVADPGTRQASLTH
ncbi:MAG: calcium-binding protein [Pigmentiphaga sp.]